MKKSLVALAALAATAAFAQSSVTLYGIADAYVGQTKALGSVAVPNPSSQTVVNSSGLSVSRIGLSVKEDLGAGLQGFVVFENGVNTDTGTGAGNRKSVLGLTGSFGTVSLGNQQEALSQVLENVLDAQSDSAFSAVAGSRNSAAKLLANPARNTALFNTTANSVRYDTPNFDGFTAAVQVGLGENKNVPAVGRATRNTSFNVQYANGPLALALAHGIAENKVGPLLPAGATNNSASETALAGAYDFGMAKLNLGFTNAKQKGVPGNDKGINVGVTAPIGAFTVIGQLSRNKFTNLKNVTSFGLEGHYALSKRTTSYVGFNQTKDSNLAAPVNNKARAFGVGVRHVF